MSYAGAYDPLDGVAIVAVAGRFPGARDVEEFWQNLVAGRETISHFSEDELEPLTRSTWRAVAIRTTFGRGGSSMTSSSSMPRSSR